MLCPPTKIFDKITLKYFHLLIVKNHDVPNWYFLIKRWIKSIMKPFHRLLDTSVIHLNKYETIDFRLQSLE